MKFKRPQPPVIEYVTLTVTLAAREAMESDRLRVKILSDLLSWPACPDVAREGHFQVLHCLPPTSNQSRCSRSAAPLRGGVNRLGLSGSEGCILESGEPAEAGPWMADLELLGSPG